MNGDDIDVTQWKPDPALLAEIERIRKLKAALAEEWRERLRHSEGPFCGPGEAMVY